MRRAWAAVRGGRPSRRQRRAREPVLAALELAEAGVERERPERARAAEVVVGPGDRDRRTGREQPLVDRHPRPGGEFDRYLGRLAADPALARRIAAGGATAYRERASEAILGARWRGLIEALV